jgi:hypothetical protein
VGERRLYDHNGNRPDNFEEGSSAEGGSCISAIDLGDGRGTSGSSKAAERFWSLGAAILLPRGSCNDRTCIMWDWILPASPFNEATKKIAEASLVANAERSDKEYGE